MFPSTARLLEAAEKTWRLRSFARSRRRMSCNRSQTSQLFGALQAAPFVYVPGTFNTRDLGLLSSATGGRRLSGLASCTGRVRSTC